jgi:peptide deformylase
MTNDGTEFKASGATTGPAAPAPLDPTPLEEIINRATNRLLWLDKQDKAVRESNAECDRTLSNIIEIAKAARRSAHRGAPEPDAYLAYSAPRFHWSAEAQRAVRGFAHWLRMRAPQEVAQGGPWKEAFRVVATNVEESHWIVWRDDGPDADCPQLGPLSSESEAIAMRDLLNGAVGGIEPAPEPTDGQIWAFAGAIDHAYAEDYHAALAAGVPEPEAYSATVATVRNIVAALRIAQALVAPAPERALLRRWLHSVAPRAVEGQPETFDALIADTKSLLEGVEPAPAPEPPDWAAIDDYLHEEISLEKLSERLGCNIADLQGLSSLMALTVLPSRRPEFHATYNGGWHGNADGMRAFHHGMDTVFNALDKAVNAITVRSDLGDYAAAPEPPDRIRILGDPILRFPAARFTGHAGALLERLTLAMRAAKGVGLAAPQIGEAVCVAVIEGDDWHYDLVNPRILWRSDELETRPEGCLSIPGYEVPVTRPARINLDTGLEIVTLDGLAARAAQHEIDHLNGVLILDRALAGARVSERPAPPKCDHCQGAMELVWVCDHKHPVVYRFVENK